MAKAQGFKKRIKSVENIKQITKAMEMVASVKMQKAQKQILQARNYVSEAWEILKFLGESEQKGKHPLLKKRPIKNSLIIVVASDKGLCGSFNSDVYKELKSLLNSSRPLGVKKDFVAVGRKASDIVKKHKFGEIVAEFSDFGKEIDFEESRPITSLACDGFLRKKYDQVLIVFSHFKSSLTQTPTTKQLLPIEADDVEVSEENKEYKKTEYKFEPNPEMVLERIIPLFVKMQLYGALLESNASEHSARMMSMKNATDSASDLIDELTLIYNTMRQNSITQELAEISGASEAMS